MFRLIGVGMSRMSIILCLVIGGLWISEGTVFAAVRLPNVFGDHMVLQRERPVPVWGWASPGEKVVVEFAGQRKEAVSGQDGRWQISLEPMTARSQGEVLRVLGSGTNMIEFKDVVVGEVWVCSGQSNMQMGLGECNAPEDVARASLPELRYFSVERIIASSPKQDVKSAPWKQCSEKTAGGCTAVGFYFGRRIHSELGVPVGLIQTTWGGSGIEPWTPLEAFGTVPELAEYIAAYRKKEQDHRQALPDAMKALEQWISAARKAIADNADLPAEPAWPIYPGARDVEQPAAMYNAMVYPLIPYAIRGAIWYQGEHNCGDAVSANLYYHMMRALVGGWRRAWAQGDFPFYYVQLPNLRDADNRPSESGALANMRQRQLEALAITNTGMAVTIDIGDAKDLHPKNKFDVGERLARWALARDYGQTNMVMSGPLYRGMKIEDNRIRLFFDHVGGGLMVGEKTGREPVREVIKGKLQRFAIAGEDKKWVWADAAIDGDTVVVSSPEVPRPVAVRYAYQWNPEGCNLYNRAGLPAAPFRTDSWPKK